ncbi:hypothetical protein U9M48_005671 [Paspalum notatum var. saurae]|uniref:Reverse transcriptase zinc-binding domain-containing protein n=1 Tax=Paspalum notatum var. saurae TaxID=547442 RepID=A0AAQ3SIR9_PASNO
MPKDQAGLGILDLDTQNKSLLGKWLFKLVNEDGLWQRLLRNKYLRDKTLTQLEKKPGDSHFWSGLMGIKDQFLNLGSFILKNGTQIRFWEDIWLDGVSLKYQYPSLFNIVRKKHATIADVLGSNPLNENLVARLLNVDFEEGNDVFKWHLHKSGNFSVRSMYMHFINTGIRVSMEIWRTRLPLKIKIFLWYLKKEVILTKDNLSRHNWQGDKSCCFCYRTETIQHLFLDCKYASWVKQGGLEHESLLLTGAAGVLWALWLSRNDTVLFRGTYWLQLWAKLQRSEECEYGLLQACRKLETVAMQLFSSFGMRPNEVAFGAQPFWNGAHRCVVTNLNKSQVRMLPEISLQRPGKSVASQI